MLSPAVTCGAHGPSLLCRPVILSLQCPTVQKSMLATGFAAQDPRPLRGTGRLRKAGWGLGIMLSLAQPGWTPSGPLAGGADHFPTLCEAYRKW